LTEKPFIEIECSFQPETDPDACKYTYNLELVNDSEISVNFEFDEPLKLSQGEKPDFMNVFFWGAPTLRSASGRIVFREPLVFRVRIPQVIAVSVFSCVQLARLLVLRKLGSTNDKYLFLPAY